MKLVEIKNSLAKLYYEPTEFPLVISDFLVIDDKNQKILSQVVSIESTSKENTNCAILKFSLDLCENNTFSPYSGYTPALDANVEKVDEKTLSNIFSSAPKTINIGCLTSSTQTEIKINASILNNFLYIQSDKPEDSKNLLQKIVDFNAEQNIKTLVMDFDGISEYEKINRIELGKDFKLPIGTEILNYIYENDLTGLTLEQKTIVQDIILEIQEYIETLDSGFIPFNTLLDVVNDIYETDKSIGIILLRNKLLKYKQYNIFASTQEEIESLSNSMENNNVTVFGVSEINKNWQKESLNFAVSNLKQNYVLIMDAIDEITDKKTINKIYKTKNIKPIITSKYDFENAQTIKSFAKNLILFKPEEQQRAFAIYNSFLMKLNAKEYIVSGDTTFYTPLIIKSAPDVMTLEIVQKSIETKNNLHNEKIEASNDIQQESKDLTQLEETQEVDVIDEIEPLEIDEELSLQDNDKPNELKSIFEESLEEEIAKDVDQMFYASSNEEIEENEKTEFDENIQTSEEDNTDINNQLSDDDLDLLDDLNLTEEDESELLSEDEDIISESENTEQDSDIGILNADVPDLESTHNVDDMLTIDNTDNIELPDEIETNDILTDSKAIQSDIINDESTSSIPIYKTELDSTENVSENIKIAEGNIVYHEKYGRGVVEELFAYGKRTLCAIQFDNVGRRLMDPNLAELKQM